MRYLGLWFQFCKMSLMADMEYRLNLVVRVFGEIFWYAAQMSTFEVLYLHTPLIQGWDVNAMRVFMGCLFLADVIYMILLHENMDQIATLVRKGDLDMYLVKPINSQFMVSFRKISSAYLVNFWMVVGFLVWAILRLPKAPSMLQIFTFALLMICGVTITYSMRFLFSTLSVVFHNASSVQFLWYQVYRLGTRPDILYPRMLRLVLLSALPIGFVASVPSRVLVDGFEWTFLAGGVALAAGFLCLSSLAWNRALRSYSSASS